MAGVARGGVRFWQGTDHCRAMTVRRLVYTGSQDKGNGPVGDAAELGEAGAATLWLGLLAKSE